MLKNFDKDKYNYRSKVETVISVEKEYLGIVMLAEAIG